MCARARERESIEWYQCVRCKESMHAYWAVLFWFYSNQLARKPCKRQSASHSLSSSAIHVKALLLSEFFFWGFLDVCRSDSVIISLLDMGLCVSWAWWVCSCAPVCTRVAYRHGSQADPPGPGRCNWRRPSSSFRLKELRVEFLSLFWTARSDYHWFIMPSALSICAIFICLHHYLDSVGTAHCLGVGCVGHTCVFVVVKVCWHHLVNACVEHTKRSDDILPSISHMCSCVCACQRWWHAKVYRWYLGGGKREELINSIFSGHHCWTNLQHLALVVLNDYWVSFLWICEKSPEKLSDRQIHSSFPRRSFPLCKISRSTDRNDTHPDAFKGANKNLYASGWVSECRFCPSIDLVSTVEKTSLENSSVSVHWSTFGVRFHRFVTKRPRNRSIPPKFSVANSLNKHGNLDRRLFKLKFADFSTRETGVCGKRKGCSPEALPTELDQSKAESFTHKRN